MATMFGMILLCVFGILTNIQIIAKQTSFEEHIIFSSLYMGLLSVAMIYFLGRKSFEPKPIYILCGIYVGALILGLVPGIAMQAREMANSYKFTGIAMPYQEALQSFFPVVIVAIVVSSLLAWLCICINAAADPTNTP